MVQADGCRFVGCIKDTGITQETSPLVGPLTRPAPDKYETKWRDGKMELVQPLTVTQADLGCQVTFLNFKPVFDTKTIYPMVHWGTTLDGILSFYTTADLLQMNKAMDALSPSAGTKAARTAVYNKLYVAYYMDTGLDVTTGKEPKGDNLDWVEKELKKRHQRKTDIAKRVKQARA